MADYNVPDYVVSRLRYFNGQFLKEQDFIDEQKFHLGQAWRHQRLLHVSGVAAGLDVSVASNGTSILVAAGSAVDDAGRQILLSSSQTIAVPPGSGPWVVEIAYAEQATNVADVSSPVQDFTRFSQSVNPIAITSTLSAGAVLLAELVISAGVVTVKLTKRKYSGVRLPDAGGGGIALRARGDVAVGWGQLEGSLSVLGALAVTGDVSAAAAVSVAGALTANGGLAVTGGNASVSNNLSVTGASTLTGVVNANGGLNGPNGTLNVNNNLAVAGASTFTGAVNANGGINTTSNLSVTGTSTLTGVLNANGGINTGSIGVGGSSTFTGALNANGGINAASGTLNVNNNLSVTAASTFNGAVTAKNGVAITTGNLSVAGTSTFTGAVAANGGLTASSATVSGALAANGGLTASSATVSGALTANSGITATSATISGVTYANGGLNASTATISGVANAWGGFNAWTGTFTGLLNANGGIIGASGSLSVQGAMYVAGSVGINIWPPRSRLDLGSGGVGTSLRVGAYFDIGGTYTNNMAYIGVNAVLSTSDTSGNRFKPVHWGPSPVGGGMVLSQLAGGLGELDFWGINWNNDASEKVFPDAFTHVMRLGINGNVGIGTGGGGPAAKLDVNGNLRVASDANVLGNAVVSGTMQAGTFAFPLPVGDPSPVITTRTMPANQGGSSERTELILFAANDGTGGSGPDTITLRAPHIRLQTYNDVSVSDINNAAGSNDRLSIDSNGKIASPMWRVTQVLNMKPGALPVSGTFTSGGGTLVLLVSGSGWGPNGAVIGFDILVDDVTRGNALTYTNLNGCHLAINANPLVVTGVAAGTHTVKLVARSSITTDYNDFFSVTVMELPF
ncbi:Flagellar hook-length control protein FliK [Minicystis rosea]|nr:Flagellar hook-length control protein FliK [Minicystis rosea]